MKEKYLLAYMDMLERFALTSEAKRLQVAACLIKQGSILSIGINGTPEGWYTNACEDQEGNTQWFTRHAEEACLARMLRSTETTEGAIMLVTHNPCRMCSIKIKSAGIEKVYYRHAYRDFSGVEYLQANNIAIQRI